MATRQYYSAKATAEASTTATSPQDFVSLSFTPDDNASYLMVWSAQVESPTLTNTDTRADFITNASATLWAQAINPKDVNDYMPIFGHGWATFATATGSHTFKLRYSQETATGNVSRIRDGSIVAIKLATCDVYQGTTTESASTATNETIYTTATTLSFTPSATGPYLIIGSGEPVFGNTNRPFWFKLTDGTTNYGNIGLSSPNFNAESWGTAVRLDLTATQWDFSLQHTSSTSGNSGRLRNPRITAIRLDQFATEYYAEARTRSTVTSTSFATQVSLTQTPAAKDHLVVVGALLGVQNTANDVIGKFTEAGSSILDWNEEMNDNTIGEDASRFMAFDVRTLAASSTTWTVQYTNETASLNANASEAFISIINLDSTGGGGGGSTTPLSFSVSAVGVARLIKEPRLTLAARASGVALIVRLMLLNMATTSAVLSATVSLLRVTLVNLAATVRLAATVTKQAQLTLAASVRESAAIVKKALLTQVATAKASTLAVRVVSLARSASVKGAATVSVLRVTLLTLAASVKAAASLSIQVAKTLGATAVGAAAVSLSATVAEVVANVTKLTGHAGLGIYLKMKRSWQRRRSNWKPRGIEK